MARKSKSSVDNTLKPRDALIDAGLGLASLEGWQNVTMAKIAMEAGLSLADATSEFSSKSQVLAAFSRRVDLAVLSSVVFAKEEETARDRLFEVLMRRFDVLSPYKHGLHAVISGFRYEPISGVCSCARIHASMRLMLETAGLGSTGFQGELKARGLTIIYANSFRVWLDDESPDLAATMAALDRSLMRAEQIMGLLKLGGQDQSWRDHK